MTTIPTEIKISINQHISDLDPFKTSGIPTNSIIHKEVPGCGITTFEIRCMLHNSIIILPNKPVIEDKVAKHNTKFPDELILGVHKGIDVNDIKRYLLNPKAPIKKILTTPEGFIKKVIKAFKDDLEALTNNYFLLYDECERIITDVSYRGQIAAPLDLFFDFPNKALVSATTLPISDERFKNFDHYKIVPDYDYSKPLTVINTNNIIGSLETLLDKLQSKNVFIFFNSTNGIAAVNKTLEITKESKAYCSSDSVVKLTLNKYPHASSYLDCNDLAKYNFLTSRYYSAVDIELDHKPDVIIMSDIYFALHSMIDPRTEAIQIAGRFRKGINSITHITNFKSTMEVMTPEEALKYLEGGLDVFDIFVNEMKKTKNRGSADALKWFINESPMAAFYSNGKRNSFMIDNDLHQERVKNYYVDIDKLQLAYQDISKHFQVTTHNEEYVVGDSDFHTLNQLESVMSRNQEAARLLDRYIQKPGRFLLMIGDITTERGFLTRKYPLVAEAVNLWGYENLKEIGFTNDDLKKAIKRGKQIELIYKLSKPVHAAFKDDGFVPENDIKETLITIYEEHGISLKAVATHIKNYFKTERTSQHQVNGYHLNTPIYPQPIQIK